MTTKKQAKLQAQKKQREHDARVASKQRKRERTIRIVAIVLIATLVLGGGLAVILVAINENRAERAAAEASAAAATDAAVELESGWAVSPEPPDPAYAEDRTWTATLETSQGDIVIELDGTAAPQAVASFVALAEEGYFDGTDCHRLTTDGIYVIQCGDPTGTGSGGPGYRYGPIENAPADDVYPAGTVAMARVSGDGESMGSQFFIVYQDSTIPSDAAGGYTVLGQVTSGTANVDRVADAGTITGDSDGSPAIPLIVNEVSVS